jgi:hypothetical protein
LGWELLRASFLAVVPAAGDDASGDPSDELLLNLYHQILEWIGAADGTAELFSSDPSTPAAADTSIAGTGGGAYPATSPYIPPGG